MNEAALNYVGTNKESGRVQFEILKAEGLSPHHRLLEIGCGHLHAAVPIVAYLEKSHYVGIDPNTWIQESAKEEKAVHDLMIEREAKFINVSDFDARSQCQFDYVFAHSVLSHCAYWQLDQFLANTSKNLSEDGKIIASIRLAEGNQYGSSGNDDMDSKDSDWQYPGVSWFRHETVAVAAFRLGLISMLKPNYTALMIKSRPQECHDWFVFRRP